MGVYVITGANRGIGLELAKQLSARGEKVIGVCRTSSKELEECAEEVIDGVDVTEPDSVKGLAARLKKRSISVLINNAGLLERTALGELDYDSIHRQFEINAVGPLRVTEALLGNLGSDSKVALLTSRMGSIEDNTSGSHYGYRMSKAALNIAGKSLAIDLAERGISVVILHPGFVRTGMTGGNGFVDPDEAAGMLIDRIDDLSLKTSGRFLHANGEQLPW
ncbi:MAG: SDR family oxidoreductase [Myxococcales bacterium]|nr:SDR family oxidoreductase [Myxococcales bacterium]